MSASQRTKGRRGEQEFVSFLRKAGQQAERTWQTAQGKNPECDVLWEGRPVQVKRRKAGFGYLYKAIKGVDGVALRDDGQEWLLVFRLTDCL